MARQETEIVVVPHYIGTKTAAEVFKRIFTEQIENELRKTEKQTNTNTSDENKARETA